MTSISSAGWPAFSNMRIDCSVGVMPSLAVWKNSTGRGAMLPTTSSARKLYMLHAVSTGISMIAFGERFRRSGSGIGTASKREIHMLSPVSALCRRPCSSRPVNFAQASGSWVLAAELALAVAPAAGGDHAGEALVHARRIDRDRGAEAVADHADPRRIDLRRGRRGR